MCVFVCGRVAMCVSNSNSLCVWWSRMSIDTQMKNLPASTTNADWMKRHCTFGGMDRHNLSFCFKISNVPKGVNWFNNDLGIRCCGNVICAAITANAADHGCKRRYSTAAATWTAVVQVLWTMTGWWCRWIYVPVNRYIQSRNRFLQYSLQFRLATLLRCRIRFVRLARDRHRRAPWKLRVAGSAIRTRWRRRRR